MTKVAVISGSASGIGQATAIKLAEMGFALALVTRNQSLDQTKCALPRQAEYNEYRCDIADESQVKNLFLSVMADFGRVDVVINNAGVGSMGFIANVPTEEFDRVFNINCRGTFFMCREAAEFMGNGGAIINVSTGITHSSEIGMGVYVASKLAVEGLSKTLAKELGSKGIRVNTVSPGMTDTPMLMGGHADKLKASGAAMTALKRLGEAKDVANVIAMLVSDEGRWITGNNIQAGGGSVIY
ncbi:MAG: SDR family oxidoreductase [Cellvibrionales bacterium]|nr:SDR family oxidoreductase [Cellvibrionales bacterium]